MSVKIILGGGLIAYMARDILGGDWRILSNGRSRFYSFTPPISDNYIVKTNEIAEYIQRFQVIPRPRKHKIAYSYGGNLTFNPIIALPHYTKKLYGASASADIQAYLANHLEFEVYDGCVEIYNLLLDKYRCEQCNIASISDHRIVSDLGEFEYDEIISTVPLNVLYGWRGEYRTLAAYDLYCYHVRTDCLDFEGADQVHTSDPEIEFHKAIKLDRVNYVFHSCRPIEFPGRYFMKFMDRFDLIAEMNIPNAVCHGPIPDTANIGSDDITCIGRSAVWDDRIGVADCISQIMGHNSAN